MTPRAGDEARLIAAVLQAFEEAGSEYERVLDLVCQLGCELTGDPWVIRLVDDAGMLHLAGSAAVDVETLADIRQTLTGLTMPYERSRVASVTPEGAPVLITPENLAASSHTAQPAIVALAERRGFVGGLVAPMRVRGRVIGVLWWPCRYHLGEHDEDDLRLIATVADRCALAIDNARLVRNLESERNRHAALLAQVSDAVAVVDADGTIRHVTAGGVTRILGWLPEELLGLNMFELVHRKDHALALEGFVHALGPDDMPPLVLRARHREGGWRHLYVSAQNLLDDDVVGGVVVTAHDVTQQVLANALLNDENEILERVATGAPLTDTLDAVCRMIDGHVRHGVSTIWLVDDESHVLVPTAGPNAGPLPNIEPEHSRRGVDFVQLLPPDEISVSTPATGPEWEPWREQAIASGIGCSWTRPIRDAQDLVYGAVILYRSDEREPTETERTAIELGARLAAVAVHRARDADQLAHAATHDTVTNLPNRRLFLERLRQAVARQERGAAAPSVLFLDLDRFKQVNDRAGHAAGDEVLRLLGARLQAVVRPTDVVARFGGDEFAVLCDETTDDEAISVSERLLAAICEPLELAGRRHHLSASIGIATGRSNVSHDALVRRADVAMYRAKALGSGGIVSFTSGMAESPRADLEHDLRRAIEADEIFVHYQPIVDLRTARWSGVEALARWRHPEQGWVPPTVFVTLAEEIGMAVRLGDSVLTRVCRDAARWAHDPVMRHQGLGINVSGRQLADPRFVGSVQRQLQESGVAGNRFIVELTETTMMEEFESAMASVTALRSLGMSLAIDDFGTGHSTLARLRQFPAVGLKLDRSFIVELGEDERSADIVAAVVQLAHAVGMAVCAEGVETREQLAMVQRLGVDLAQGFLLGRPLPPDEVRELLARPPAVQPILTMEHLPL
ncbi:MAG TPA: EAL domain-containing protein [Acidimicrobiales bacterium]|nr:EAL domain-containing protein [Acidimicrobiales bacterium]